MTILYLYEVEKRAFAKLFWFISQQVQINYIFTDNVYCAYSAMPKSPNQLLNCLKRAETIIALIIFNGVLGQLPT